MASPSLLQARLRVPRGIIRAASGLGPAFFDGIDKFTPTGAAAQPVKPIISETVVKISAPGDGGRNGGKNGEFSRLWTAVAGAIRS